MELLTQGGLCVTHVHAYKNTQLGSSLILVLGIALAVALTLYFLQIPIQNQMLALHRDLAKERLNILTYKILGTLQNDSAWAKTIDMNAGMGCLKTSSCSDLEQTFDLFAADGEPIVISSSNSGFTLQGLFCPPEHPFTIDAQEPLCPFQVRLFWKPHCTGCSRQEANIRAEIKVITSLAFSPQIFSERLAFTRSKYAGTIDKFCSEMGGRFNQDLEKCEFPFQGKNCLQGQKLVGISDDTTEVICVDTPAISLTPCSGAADGFNSDGSMRCL